MFSNRLKSFFGILFAVSVLFVHYSCQAQPKDFSFLKEGDILFQDSQSRQGEAVKLATHSEWTHVGMVVKHDGKLMVLEGVQPVKYTPIRSWVNHGKDSYFEVKRLKDKELTEELLAKMRVSGNQLVGTDYDIYFNWADNQIYCSELVWKVYKRGTGIELCPLRKLESFDLKHPLVKMIMKERYGNNIPYNESVVAPSDLYESELLIDVAVEKQ